MLVMTHIIKDIVDVSKLVLNENVLERDFWLYVSAIKDNKSDSEYSYLGLTGDITSANAGSPMGSLSMHLNN
jgi:hypothetical protein